MCVLACLRVCAWYYEGCVGVCRFLPGFKRNTSAHKDAESHEIWIRKTTVDGKRRTVFKWRSKEVDLYVCGMLLYSKLRCLHCSCFVYARYLHLRILGP
jgi:hypothetical protein